MVLSHLYTDAFRGRVSYCRSLLRLLPQVSSLCVLPPFTGMFLSPVFKSTNWLPRGPRLSLPPCDGTTFYGTALPQRTESKTTPFVLVRPSVCSASSRAPPYLYPVSFSIFPPNGGANETGPRAVGPRSRRRHLPQPNGSAVVRGVPRGHSSGGRVLAGEKGTKTGGTREDKDARERERKTDGWRWYKVEV